MSNTGQAWVTLATNDSYALGALVLAQSLKRNNTIHQLAILITPGVSPAMKEVLSTTFDLVKEVDVLDSKDSANLALLARPDLGITFTKLHCWNLTQYTKCVFLDADTLVVKNCDELFERDELSAAPDAGWPDCFNSGVFVFTPSEATYKGLLEYALEQGSFDGGDQGLLNMFFSDWATKDITKHLPFIYNMVASATYSYLPAFKVFGGKVKIAHFIGSNKPWLQARPDSSTLSEFLNIWWNIYQSDVSSKLNTNMIINCTVFEEGPQASKFSTPPPSPPGTELRHVFVDPWDYVQQGKSKPDSTNSLNTEDVIDRLVEHLKETHRNQNQTGPTSQSNRPQTTYTKPYSAPNLTPHSQEPVPTHQQSFDMRKISGSLQALQSPRQSQNHYNHSHGHLEQVCEVEPLRRAEPCENIPSTISPPFTPCVEQTSLQEQTRVTEDANQQGGLAGALAGGQKDVIQDQWRRQSWEQGNIDYMGVDAFENIWKKISKTVGESIKPLEGPVPEEPAGVEPAVEVKAPAVEVKAPAVEVNAPAAGAPVTPVPETLATTVAEAPATPAAEVPAKPQGGASAIPAAESPVTAVAEVTAAPSAAAPAEPSAAAPAAPSVAAPPAPPAAAPAAPSAAAPAAPSAAAPAAPSAAAPAAPSAAAPAAPSAVAPAAPSAVAPAAPSAAVPATIGAVEAPTAPAPVADKPTKVPEKTEDKTDAPKPEELKPSEPEPADAPVISEPKKPQEAPNKPAAQPPAPLDKPATQAGQPATKEAAAAAAAVVSAVPAAVVEHVSSPVATAEPVPKKPAELKSDSAPQEASAPPVSVESAPPAPAPKPSAQPPSTPPAGSKKELPQPKEDSKSSEPPKDGGAEASSPPALADSAPSSPAVPSPASPSAPEGAKSDSAPPPSESAPSAETSTPPQTPVGEAPVPPKRRSTKGKAKK